MKVRVVYNSTIPFILGVDGITLYPFVFIGLLQSDPRTPKLLKHEMVHVEQVQKLGWFKFYSTYIWYYLINLIKYRDARKAYLNIPYEVEAYERQEQP